jgi:RNA-directed DNA polymerase
MNTGALPVPPVARERVLGIQRKLHQWASDDPQRRFNDLHNLVCDPAVLMVAWLRVRSNTGSRSARGEPFLLQCHSLTRGDNR